MTKAQRQAAWAYLNQARATGTFNVYTTPLALCERLGLSQQDALQITHQWMTAYARRVNPSGRRSWRHGDETT